MSDEELNKPVTAKYLTEYTEKIVFPRVEEIVDEKMRKYTDEILTSNDKLSVKLDKILAEQAAITVAYKRLEKKINRLEAVVKILAEKAGVPMPDLSAEN